jgi:cellulose synthase/poly-beta-1,6-N-acetylglucosamine synthase-like glycosyltransferase
MIVTNFNREDIYVLCDNTILKNKSFIKSAQPLLWLLANNAIKRPKYFYRDVANQLSLKYQEDLPVFINSASSIARKIGISKLSQLCFFPYIEKETLIIACPDPFQTQEIVKACSPIIDKQKIEFRISSLNTVREAIAQSGYTVASQNAENFLHTKMPQFSSKNVLSTNYRVALSVIILVLVGCFIFKPSLSTLIFFIVINILYFIMNPLRLVVSIFGAKKQLETVSDKEIQDVPDELLPVYTILVPIKNEPTIIPSLINHLKMIDYPHDKLDIKLIVEVNDHLSLETIYTQGLGNGDIDENNSIFHLVKVPISGLSTKPRSCNYALQFARGQLCVVYDAEDRPDPLQLRKAYAVFLREKLNTLCVQAKLNFYNTNQNLLTKFFTLEYGFWYDYMLPGLEAMNIPIPLGGTSNHFITNNLKQIGTWDPYNVTEDADIGWRLSRLGYRTTMLQSYTLEEANSQINNWIRQRTRWQKGFLLTNLVHLRHPIQLFNELGLYGALSSATIFATNFLMPIINPILWILFILWYIPPIFGLTPIGITLAPWLGILGLFNLILGNGIYIVIHAVTAIQKRQWKLLIIVPIMPLYWLLISVASYRAIYQTITKPYLWEKTKHGL